MYLCSASSAFETMLSFTDASHPPDFLLYSMPHCRSNHQQKLFALCGSVLKQNVNSLYLPSFDTVLQYCWHFVHTGSQGWF